MPKKDFSLLGLDRPEYIPHPGGILSSLAWSRAELGGVCPPPVQFLAYAPTVGAGEEKYIYTKPSKKNGRLDRLAAVLMTGVEGADKDGGVAAAKAFRDEIEVRGSSKSKRSSVVPLNWKMAIMQDPRGLTGKAGPANIPKIFDQLGYLGGAGCSLSDMFCKMLIEHKDAGVPSWLDEASTAMLPNELKSTTLKGSDRGATKIEIRSPAWMQTAPGPFHWLSKSWQAICSPEWIQAMPRRRWADWATCVARTGMAAGFAYEMLLYSTVVPALATDEDPTLVFNRFQSASTRFLPWDNSKRVSERDVGSSLKSLSVKGLACMEVLKELAKSDLSSSVPEPKAYDDDPNGLRTWLATARDALSASRYEIKEKVLVALEQTSPGGLSNLHEMIRSSFLSRGAEDGQDLYALLKPAGTRYSYVDPGQEWLVVVSALSSAGPGRVSRLRDLNASLQQLGIQAAATTIVDQLEAYGLARSTHDADDAVEIQPAF